MRTLTIVLAVVTGLAAGCKKDSAKQRPTGDNPLAANPVVTPAVKDDSPPASSTLDINALAQGLRLAQRADLVLARPDVDKAFDQMIEAVFADPAVSEIGDKLMEKIGADPGVAEGAAVITNAIAEDPNVIRRVQKMMRDDPGMTPDQVGEAFAAEFSRTFDVLLAKPVENAAQRALEEIEVGAEKAKLLGQLTAKLDASIQAYIADPQRIGTWEKRLTELNGGVMPSATKAAQLFEQHALTDERIAAYLVTVLADPATRAQVAAFLRDVVLTGSVEDAIVKAARDLVRDPEIQRHAIAAMSTAMDPRGTPGAATKQVNALFEAKPFRAGLTKVVKTFMIEPSVASAIDDSLRAVWASPAVRKATETMLDGW